MGDRPFGARTRFELARVLLDRGRRGRPRARARAARAGARFRPGDRAWSRLVREALAARLEAQGLGSLDVSTSIDFMIDEVASEQPDIAAHAAPDGQVTILFSDIEDSTLMTERLGDERWLQVLRAHNSLFRRLVRGHGGYEVKNQGDGFMLVFPDPGPRARMRGRDPARSSAERETRSRASGSGCGWACTPARRSARRATSSGAA